MNPLFSTIILLFVGLVISPTVALATSCDEEEPPSVTLVEPQKSSVCFDRHAKNAYFFKVDSHLHFQPFGGKAIPHEEVVGYLRRLKIAHANMYGIGQILPYASTCTYYADCPGIPVKPSIQNDFLNANRISKLDKNDNPELTLSMAFFDFSQSEKVERQMALLNHEYPGLFKWAGEINLVKQALFDNGHTAITKAQIVEWATFMQQLRERNIPLSIHADLGNNDQKMKYLHLMKYVLQSYPNNLIVWLHLGLSKELTKIDPEVHIAILQSLLDKHANLMLDLSWRVLYDHYFKDPAIRPYYVDFINKNYNRFLTGTDFIASDKNSYEDYAEAVKLTSDIHLDLDDRAFRHVALGLNYYRLLGMEKNVPEICPKTN